MNVDGYPTGRRASRGLFRDTSVQGNRPIVGLELGLKIGKLSIKEFSLTGDLNSSRSFKAIHNGFYYSVRGNSLSFQGLGEGRMNEW